jgi:two-component system phosphate regulon sensor histidine kinase PhoR
VLSLKKEGNKVRIKVTDNGIGIPEGDIPRIFDRFYRVDRSRHRDTPGGSGLGLAICQWIVQAHRGEIKVESKPGQGSTFTVSLPG